MSIILMVGRHGETRLNSEGKLRGWLDVPLNKVGIKEAEAMGLLMEKFPIDRIYCSDLDRANHTAEIVAKHHNLKPIKRSWWRPLHYGDLEGKAIKDIQPTLDKLNEIWKTDPDHAAPNGESFTEFQRRNLSGLGAVMDSASQNEQIMIVAHLRNCLLFHAVSVNGAPLEGEAVQLMDGKDFHQDSGAVSKYSWDGDKLHYEGML